MKKKIAILACVSNIILSLTGVLTVANASVSNSPWRFNIDLEYEKEEIIQAQEKKITDELSHEYQLRYDAPLSLETRLEGELKTKFAQEKHDDSLTPDSKSYEPYTRFKIKSHIYETQFGYKKSEEDTSTTTETNNAFVDLKLQPEYLPEFSAKYDFERTLDPEQPERLLHKFSLNSLYNIKGLLKIRLNYQGDITDEKIRRTDQKERDINEGNLLGQVTLKHFIFDQRVMFDVDYKFEKEREKAVDPNDNYWEWQHDRVTHNTNSKLIYRISPDTSLGTHYENINTEDKIAEDEREDTFSVDMDQRLWSFIRLDAKYSSEQDKTEEIEDTLTDTYEGKILVNPKPWLDLTGRVKFEMKDINDLTSSNYDKNQDNQNIEGSWRANFPNFFQSNNTFTVRLIEEKEDDIDSSKETYYKWKFQLTPITNLLLTPEYNMSDEEKTSPTEDITHEFKTTVSYNLNLSEQMKLELAHTFERKRVKGTDESYDNYKVREHNDDTEFNLSLTPVPNLILSTQILREARKMINNDFVQRDEVDTSYTLKYDWRFDPFTWSTSLKYDDQSHKDEDQNEIGNDTETIESKLSYQIKSYDLSTNYQYRKTYFKESDDKEQRIGFKISAYY